MNDEPAFIGERITAEGIENVQFPMRVRGYDREEVDAFLGVVATEVRALLEARASASTDEEEADPYAKLGSDAGRLMQLARDHADRIERESREQLAAERAAADAEIAELKEHAETEAAALREMALRDVTAMRDEADRVRSDAEVRSAEMTIEAENEAARARESAQAARREAEAEIRDLKAAASEDAKRVKMKARADYTVVTREAQREANRIEKEARQRADHLKDEAEADAADRLRKARSEVRKLRDTEAELRHRIDSLKGELDDAGGQENKDQVGDYKSLPIDLTDSRSGPA
jgi:DivIVA domain-containing protein